MRGEGISLGGLFSFIPLSKQVEGEGVRRFREAREEEGMQH